MDRKLRFKKAFSLTELMLVLAIMAILSGLLQVNISERKQEAEVKNIVECVKAYELAFSMYYLHHNGSEDTFSSVTDGATLESIDDLERFRAINFSTNNLIKSENCTGIVYYNSEGNFGIKINFASNRERFIGKVVHELKQSCVESQVVVDGDCIYFYLRDSSGNIYV